MVNAPLVFHYLFSEAPFRVANSWAFTRRSESGAESRTSSATMVEHGRYLRATSRYRAKSTISRSERQAYRVHLLKGPSESF
jgi:hypothetical protein